MRFDTKTKGGGRNAAKREAITASLMKQGFKKGGTFSTSGVFGVEKNQRGWKVTFGCRSNIAGEKGNKYFTVYKYFSSKTEVEVFLKVFKENKKCKE